MRFISQLKVSQRFTLLGLIALVLAMIPTILYTQASFQSVQVAEQEAQGIPPVKALLLVIQLTQQHRGLSALVLGGNTASQAARSAKQDEVNQAQQTLSELLAPRASDAELLAAWRKAQQDWSNLREQVASGKASVAQSFEAHTALVATLVLTLDSLADAFGLSLDPEADTFHLIMSAIYATPPLTEELGKARAKGTGMLATKTASDLDRLALGVFLSQATAASDKVLRSFEKAAKASDRIRDRLASASQAAAALTQQATKLASEQKIGRAHV